MTDVKHRNMGRRYAVYLGADTPGDYLDRWQTRAQAVNAARAALRTSDADVATVRIDLWMMDRLIRRNTGTIRQVYAAQQRDRSKGVTNDAEQQS